MLDSDSWQRVEGLFAEALSLPREKRSAFLDKACSGDEALRAEVASLLASYEKSDTFLESIDADQAEELMKETVRPEPRDGERIGPWRIVRELGRGGMGVVYLAERADGQFEQTVALKLVKRGMDSDAILARFLNERQVLATLQHPHIARLYDGGITGEGQPYFAMEYIDGVPITDYCDAHGLSIDERLALFAKVCRAVEHAHNRLIIHRDLKPSNILVTEEGEPRLLDFGLAKLLQDPAGEEPTTRTGRRWMTLEYASPEQVKGDSVGTPSDTYQLGLVLYELLTGRRAYTVEGLSSTEAERVICEEDPPKPSAAIVSGDGVASTGRSMLRDAPEKLRKRLRGDLDTVILKALHKDPARGYASAETLANDIERHLEELPILARPDTTAYRVRKFVQRHRWGVAAATAIVLSLVGGLGAALWQAHQTRLAAERATRIKDQLIDLFVNPDDPREAVATTREFLDHGVARLRDLPLDDPLREDLAGVLVGLYNQLGLPEHAERLADAELGGSPVDPERAAGADLRLLTEWATAKWVRSWDLDTVWRTLVLATERARSGSTVLAEALIARARNGIVLGHYRDAEAATRQAIAILEKRVPATDRRVVTARLELAAALVGQRRNTEGRAETERLIAEYPYRDTRLRQRILVMAALRRALFGKFAAAEILFAENDSIKMRRDSTEIWPFDEVSHAVNAFDLGQLAKSEAALAVMAQAQLYDERLAETHWLHGELALNRGEDEEAATRFGEARRLESRRHLKVYYAALQAVALDRAGHEAEASAAVVDARRKAADFEAPNVAMALLEAADAAVSGTQSDGMDRAEGFVRALAILVSAKEHPAVLEDQLKENRDAVRIRLWKARTELDAGTVNRAQATIAEALTLGRSTLGEEHPFVRELESLRIQ